ncbi:MAG: SDR family oxidoreductase [Leptospirales bacterium]|nr:SDR family oxidoreductase [Leptospirales bacterium]
MRSKSSALRTAVLISGASSGIGRALALELERLGVFVYAGVRNLSRARQDPGESPLRKLLPLDVTRPAQLHQARKVIQKDGRQLLVLVNNAGYGLYGAFEELSDSEFRDQYATNFFGLLDLTRTMLPLLHASAAAGLRPRILNVSSVLGFLALPTGTAYCSSKWAVEGFTEALRYELAARNIQASLIEPGLIRTNFKNNMASPAASQKPDSPYAPLNQQIHRQGYSRLSTSAEAAARRLAGICLKERPAARYRLGLDAHLYYALHRLLPRPLIDWLMRSAVRYAMSQQA